MRTTAVPIDVPGWQRSLLPAAVLGDGTSRAGARSVRDWIVDLVALGLSVGLGLVVFVSTMSEHSTLGLLADVVAGIVANVALWWRREHPLAVVAVAVPISALSAFGSAASLVAAFNVAVRAPVRVTAWTTVAMVTGSAVFAWVYPAPGGYDVQGLTVGVLLTAIAVGWGMLVRVQRELLVSLHEHARRVDAEHELLVERARRSERTRIAREMHDVLAHRVSLLSVHAGALEFHPDAPPEEVAQAAGVIRQTAHDALRDLRDVLGVLRADAPGEPAPLEAPQPTLEALGRLVEESRGAGMDVRSAVGVDGAGVPDGLGRTAYRVVQEGLTNARKHAPGAVVEVAVAGGPEDGLDVAVRSRPRPGREMTARDGAVPGAGTGLVGLAERVALAGGRLEHGPTPEGGFVLRAVLPWAP